MEKEPEQGQEENVSCKKWVFAGFPSRKGREKEKETKQSWTESTSECQGARASDQSGCN